MIKTGNVRGWKDEEEVRKGIKKGDESWVRKRNLLKFFKRDVEKKRKMKRRWKSAKNKNKTNNTRKVRKIIKILKVRQVRNMSCWERWRKWRWYRGRGRGRRDRCERVLVNYWRTCCTELASSDSRKTVKVNQYSCLILTYQMSYRILLNLYLLNLNLFRIKQLSSFWCF